MPATTRETQESKILNFFTFNRDAVLTPPQVKDAVGLTCPLTSVRRALTVLTASGKLTKTTEKGDGLFGTANHKWSLPISATSTV
jgi:hypothetical protein